jgi:hypothetical protein
MKGLIILTLVVILVGAGIWVGVIRSTMSDQGTIFLVVMGNPNEKTVEFDVCVELGMAHMANPRLDERNEPKWDEWIDEHFEMKDPAGNKAPHIRVAHTMLVDENKVKHLPEFYVQYQIENGKDYTLDFIGGREGNVHYRYKFTASDKYGPTRETSVPVEGNK